MSTRTRDRRPSAYQRAKQARRVELMKLWPKGCEAPAGYVAWFEWCEAQTAHGLRQKRCVHCDRFLFPQQVDGHACT